MKNPFPDMNPWLEEHWRDVHTSLLVYARDQLNAELPPGLRARVEERLAIGVEDEEKLRTYVPDVAITQEWDRPAGPGPVLGSNAAGVAVAEPEIVDLSEVKLRHLEIVNSREDVVTAMEVLSPTNKETSERRRDWSIKRVDYLRGGINLVEIDLLRGGGWVLPDRWSLCPALPEPARVCYHVCVTRPPRVNRHEFYTLPLRERLPAIRVPLRPSDPDVALDLQNLIDHCYVGGRYGVVIDYAKEPSPPLPPDEAAWAREILAASPQVVPEHLD